MAGEEGRIVARLEPASKVKVGEEAELFVDATRLQLFDPENGINLTVEQQGPPATTGDGAGGAPAAAAEGEAAAEGAPEGATAERTGEDAPPAGATGGQQQT